MVLLATELLPPPPPPELLLPVVALVRVVRLVRELPFPERVLPVVLHNVEGDAWLLVVLEARLLPLLREALWWWWYSLVTPAKCRPRLEVAFRPEAFGDRPLPWSMDEALSKLVCWPLLIVPTGVGIDVGNKLVKLYCAANG